MLTALLVALGIMFGAALAAAPANASTSPTPVATPGGAAGAVAASTSCVQDEATACVSGTIRDSDANPVKGVTVTLAGGSSSVPAVTGATGSFIFTVKAEGDYTLALDTGTLPSGLKAANGTERNLTIAFGRLVPAAFPLDGVVKGGTAAAPTTSTPLTRLWSTVSLGLLLGLLLALASIGLSLVYGTTGLSNFAHAEQVTLGGFMTYLFGIVIGLPFLLAAVIAIAICAASGFVQDRIIWQPLRRKGLSLTQLMVVTIGLQLALEYLFQYFFGATIHPVSQTIQRNTGPLNITPNAYLAMLISLVVIAAVGLLLLRTRVGRATRAVADNRALAAASGIDVDGIIRLVWTIATGLAGLAGLLYALVYGGVAWNTGAELLLLIFSAVTLGGLGTAFGAFVGAMVIGLVTQLSTLVLGTELKVAAALLILILVLVFRPQGILGRKARVG